MKKLLFLLLILPLMAVSQRPLNPEDEHRHYVRASENRSMEYVFHFHESDIMVSNVTLDNGLIATVFFSDIPVELDYFAFYIFHEGRVLRSRYIPLRRSISPYR